ncbi:MAG TPA: metallophosphoesterase family protein [Steroidobacteraceae bacterium]|nr:metallophosphoesterase family protein [Steroidobacteraceae bacterium]
MKNRQPLKVGVISDTHGLLRPETRAFLAGCDTIVHAGDVGDPVILDELSAMAPLIAVRGNNDKERWAGRLPTAELVRLGDVFAYVIHDLAELGIEPRAAGVKVVISGHSHRPRIEWRDEVLYLNPGSCGPKRFSLPISAAELEISDGAVTPRTFELL